MKKMLEVMMIQTFDRVLKPTLGKLIRNVASILLYSIFKCIGSFLLVSGESPHTHIYIYKSFD